MADEVKLNDSELDEVAGGAGEWRKYAKGSFVNYGNYIVYTDLIYAGQKFTIYARIIR